MPLPVDLSVDFLGKRLRNPFLLASAPPTGNGEMIRRAFKAGWAGAVTKTLVPDKLPIVDVTPRLASLKDSRGQIVALGNIELTAKRPLQFWIDELKALRQEFPDRMLIASLMAEVVKEDWQDLAVLLQPHVDALELNFSCPHGMPEHGMGMAVGQDPKISAMITGWVKAVAQVPVIVKLSPNVTDLPTIVRAIQRAGADAFAAINTVSALLGVDLETFDPLPSVKGQTTFSGMSGMAAKPIGLRCVAQIAQTSELPISGLGGISNWRDAAEYILVGSTTVQVGTEVMLRGYKIIEQLTRGLAEYLHRKGLSSVQELRGRTLPRFSSHEALDRETRLVYHINRETCTRCGRCVTACRDGGWDAIAVGEDRIPRVVEDKCDGCSLCQHVCHIANCITAKVFGSTTQATA